MNKQGMEQAHVEPELFAMKPGCRKIPKQIIISVTVIMAVT